MKNNPLKPGPPSGSQSFADAKKAALDKAFPGPESEDGMGPEDYPLEDVPMPGKKLPEPKPVPNSFDHPSPPMPAGPASGVYKAPGDPYSYHVNTDGSVTIASGPTGEGMTLKDGAAFKAIMGQIASGQLAPEKSEQPDAEPYLE